MRSLSLNLCTSGGLFSILHQPGGGSLHLAPANLPAAAREPPAVAPTGPPPVSLLPRVMGKAFPESERPACNAYAIRVCGLLVFLFKNKRRAEGDSGIEVGPWAMVWHSGKSGGKKPERPQTLMGKGFYPWPFVFGMAFLRPEMGFLACGLWLGVGNGKGFAGRLVRGSVGRWEICARRAVAVSACGLWPGWDWRELRR